MGVELGRIPVGPSIGAGLLVLAFAFRPIDSPWGVGLTLGAFPFGGGVLVIPASFAGIPALVSVRPRAFPFGVALAFPKTSWFVLSRDNDLVFKDESQLSTDLDHDCMDELEGARFCVFPQSIDILL